MILLTVLSPPSSLPDSDKGVLSVNIPKRLESKKPEPKRISVMHKQGQGGRSIQTGAQEHGSAMGLRSVELKHHACITTPCVRMWPRTTHIQQQQAT